MKFQSINFADFLSRSKRFFVHVNNSNFETGYCPNNGKMADILIPGSKCLFSEYSGKLQWKWEAIQINNTWVGVNTHNPNILAKDIIFKLWPYENFKSEVVLGRYRADFASEKKIIEVKNVHWDVNNIACFPDCVTARGARQMIDLANLSNEGKECYVIYIIQRNDLNKMKIADWIDPVYYQNCILANESGVKFLAFNCVWSKNGIEINKQIEYLF